METEIKISDIKLDTSFWPRANLDEEAIERYRDCLDELPPVVVDSTSMIMLDGWHRLEAHKREGKETIKAILDGCKPEFFMARAYALNAKHGLPIPNSKRDEIIVQLRGKNLTQQKIADEMNISQQRVEQILSHLLVDGKWDTHQAIRDYLSGMSLREVAEKHDVGKTTVERALREYNQRKELIQNHLQISGHLKSVVEYPDRGPWGDAKFRGNCSGYLILDLLNYCQPSNVLDPAEGSGTCGDICFDFNDIPYTGLDLKSGFNLVKDEIPRTYDFIFFHPPYWNAIKYQDAKAELPHPDNLSLCKTYDEFLAKLNQCLIKLFSVLNPGGYLAILYGDGRHDGQYYATHSDIINMKLGKLEAVIIKLRRENIERSRMFDYGNAKFIPQVHEYILLYRNS